MSILLFSSLLFCRILTGATLLIAGIAKIRNGESRFLQTIIGFNLVPKLMAVILARYLPWVEVLTGTMLLIGFLSQTAALIAYGLFLLFTGAITASLLRGKDNDCGCLGKFSPVQWRLVFRNLFLMGLLLPIYVFGGGTLAIDSPFKTRLFQADTSAFIANIGIVLTIVITIAIVILQMLIRQKVTHVDENKLQL